MRHPLRLEPEEQARIAESVAAGALPSYGYFLLLALSTLIASFGLLSNSSASVIGAMLVAPLMGPILGLGLGLSQGRPRLIGASLLAEISGVALVLLSSAAVAWLAGTENIDFQASEFAGRTRPTLYDIAIGFAAGLAGAWTTLRGSSGASAAGAAIAVSLVPPLAVAGMALAGSLGAPHLTREAFGAFMLFLANFLAIELASIAAFLLAGLGRPWGELRRGRVSVALLLHLLALTGTGLFLSTQMRELLEERALKEIARSYLTRKVPELIPGASLSDLKISPGGDQILLQASARASQEISSAMAAEMTRELQALLAERSRREVRLVVSTGIHSFVSPEGRLYQPEPTGSPDPDQQLEWALRAALELHPQVELDQWRRRDPQNPGELLVTLRSPYLFDAWMVSELQSRARSWLQVEAPQAPRLELTVRTLIGQDVTPEGPLEPDGDLYQSAETLRRRATEARCRETVLDALREIPGSRLLSVKVRHAPQAPADQATADPQEGPTGEPRVTPTPILGPPPAGIRVQVTVQTKQYLKEPLLKAWEERLRRDLKGPVELTVVNLLGRIWGDSEEALDGQPAPRPGAGASPD